MNQSKNYVINLQKIYAVIITIFMISILNGCLKPSATIEIVNETGLVVTEIYYRTSNSKEWGAIRNARYQTNPQTGRLSERPIPYTIGVGQSFTARIQSSTEPNKFPNIDVMIVGKDDRNEIVFGKYEQNVTPGAQITIARHDIHPTLTLSNQTGYDVMVYHPLFLDTSNILISFGARPGQIMPPGNYAFGSSSIFTNIHHGGHVTYVKRDLDSNQNHELRWYCGQIPRAFKKEIIFPNQNTNITLTIDDRPPVITIQNNTGRTIRQIFIKDHEAEQWGNNLLQNFLQNGESRSYWLANLDWRLFEGVDTFSISLMDQDDTAFRKLNVTITNDTTLVFNIDDRI